MIEAAAGVHAPERGFIEVVRDDSGDGPPVGGSDESGAVSSGSPAVTAVAFQGERGAYSESAALTFFADREIDPQPCSSFDQVFERVAAGDSDAGVVPIENSLAGSIHRNYDLLVRHDLSIVGEQHLRIVHCLLGLPGARPEDLRRVLSHPQALAQCEHTLDERYPEIERVPTYDTAGSALQLREESDPTAAAIAGRGAAEVYGLDVLAEGIQDDAENYTRFLILGRDPIEPGEPAKTSLVFSADNRPGILFKSLSVFALRDIDLTKLESRPLRGRPWEYLFYLDFEGRLTDERCRRAIDHLGEIATFLRIFGSYPRGAMP